MSAPTITLCLCGHGEHRHDPEEGECGRYGCPCPLFRAGESAPIMRAGTRPTAVGYYSSVQVCELSGATYRQLDYWTRTKRIAAIIPAIGSGSQRLYAARELTVARAVIHLLQYGFGLDAAFMIAERLADSGESVARIGDDIELTVRQVSA